MPESLPLPRAPRRTALVAGVLVAALLLGLSLRELELRPGDLLPGAGGLALAGDFFGRALSPALDYESEFVPRDAPSLPLYALQALGRTFLFALAALGLSLVLGSGLAFLASTAWWPESSPGARSRPGRILLPALNLAARSGAVLLRSIHELVWALLFLLSFGLSDFAAVLAIALPFAGIFAKIYAELLEEIPRAPAQALRMAGAGGLSAFILGLVVPALPDLLAFLFFRLECALRSSAVLGFFGYATIGLQIRQSFVSSYYGETWTFLWLLLAVIVLLDALSGHLRRRLGR